MPEQARTPPIITALHTLASPTGSVTYYNELDPLQGHYAKHWNKAAKSHAT